MRIKALFITVSIILLSSLVRSQDTILIQNLVNRISSQQVKQDSFFLQGAFPSYISKHRRSSFTKKDNNIFFNALISYTLKDLTSLLDSNQIKTVKEISLNSQALYSKFRNKKGRNTFNFWRTDIPTEFPYTRWIYRVKKNAALPDDLDDTVLSLMALEVTDSIAEEAHQLMQTYVNGMNKKVRVPLKIYKKYPAYSVWYGKKFPVVFDVCVLSNILTFVQKHDLKWAKADSASLDVILTCINKKHYLTKGIDISPYYTKPSIVLYHLARLMSVKKIDTLEALKPELVKTAFDEFSSSDNIMEKIILCTAIMKWGCKAPALNLPPQVKLFEELDHNGIPFFVGNIPSYLPRVYRKPLLSIRWGLFDHHCSAYNEVLLFEYLVFNKKQSIINN